MTREQAILLMPQFINRTLPVDTYLQVCRLLLEDGGLMEELRDALAIKKALLQEVPEAPKDCLAFLQQEQEREPSQLQGQLEHARDVLRLSVQTLRFVSALVS